jgi:alginate O-acetyltransferase complex protein AlgI
MIFNSFNFILLFPLVCILYWLSPRRLKNALLLALSYLIYFSENPFWALFLLVGVTAITYLIPILSKNINCNRKWILGCGFILTLWPLLFFKYYDFFNQSVIFFVNTWGIAFCFPSLDLFLPLGISFFSFQAFGYMVDASTGKVPVEKNFLDYALFIAFFPQIASGPISKASELLPQFKSVHLFNERQVTQGLKCLLWGMFLKVVIADRVGLYVNTVYDNYIHQSGLSCLFASFCYSVQIYADFSGYSLMAVGAAKVMGFDIINNFNRPYFAISVTDFWKRWHISLSRWLKDYIYIPLGGNRVSKSRNYINILITFLVSGIWHGANWTFIFWGILHGFVQCIEKWLGLQKRESSGPVKLFRIFFTFLFLNVAWIFFRMPTIHDACSVVWKIMTEMGNGDFFIPSPKSSFVYMLFGIVLLVFKEIRDEFFPDRFLFFENRCVVVRFSAYSFTLVLILLIGVLDSGQFIYANF